MRFPQWAFLHRHCARSGRTGSRSCSWRITGPLGLGSQNWCSSWPSGTRVQTSGNFMSGPWTGRRSSRWPTPRGSWHHHFGESTVYETRLRLEVEPVRQMVLFSQRKPPGSARTESCCPFCTKDWSEGCLPPPLKSMWLWLLPTMTPWKGSRWGSMTWSSGSLGGREG